MTTFNITSKKKLTVKIAAGFLGFAAIGGSAFASDYSAVDAYKGDNQLLRNRMMKSHKVDQCLSGSKKLTNFADAIDNAIDYSMTARQPMDNFYGYNPSYNAYDMPKRTEKTPVSLFSHRHCEMTKDEISHLFLKEEAHPTEQTLKQMNRFIDAYNKEYDAAKSQASGYYKKIAGHQAEIEKLDKTIAQKEHAKENNIFLRGQKAQERLAKEISEAKQEKNKIYGYISWTRQQINNIMTSSSYADRTKRLYRVFFGCMAYTESLSDPDTEKSHGVYNEHVAGVLAPEGSVKPEGVKFYEDRPAAFINLLIEKRAEIKPEIIQGLIDAGMSQEEAEAEGHKKATQIARAHAKAEIPKTWMGVGLFQYTTADGSSVHPCVQQWNQRFSGSEGCQVKEKNEAEHVSILGSELQGFNAFCGVHRINTQFDSMVNTRTARRTPEWNHASDKALKSPDDRCVSVFASPGKMFVHYSALGNFIHTINNGHGNLGILMSCVDSGMSRLGL